MPKKGRKARVKGKKFKTSAAAHKAAKGRWGSHVQYIRKVKGGYALYSYRK